MMDYLAGIYNSTVIIQLSAWISRWVFGNKDRFLTVNWQKWSWCHFIKGCLILSHLISTCRFSFIQQVKVDIISYPLVCHIPSFHGCIVRWRALSSLHRSNLSSLSVLVTFWCKVCQVQINTDNSNKTRKLPIFCCPKNSLWFEFSKIQGYVSESCL